MHNIPKIRISHVLASLFLCVVSWVALIVYMTLAVA